MAADLSGGRPQAIAGPAKSPKSPGPGDIALATCTLYGKPSAAVDERMQTVYVETTIPSYVAAHPSRQ
jgi:hypothetical protein